jgi:hypothetical protein
MIVDLGEDKLFSMVNPRNFVTFALEIVMVIINYSVHIRGISHFKMNKLGFVQINQ